MIICIYISNNLLNEIGNKQFQVVLSLSRVMINPCTVECYNIGVQKWDVHQQKAHPVILTCEIQNIYRCDTLNIIINKI